MIEYEKFLEDLVRHRKILDKLSNVVQNEQCSTAVRKSNFNEDGRSGMINIAL